MEDLRNWFCISFDVNNVNKCFFLYLVQTKSLVCVFQVNGKDNSRLDESIGSLFSYKYSLLNYVMQVWVFKLYLKGAKRDICQSVVTESSWVRPNNIFFSLIQYSVAHQCPWPHFSGGFTLNTKLAASAPHCSLEPWAQAIRQTLPPDRAGKTGTHHCVQQLGVIRQSGHP